MVQESRSLLIQQLLQGGFTEEDDDDEDEDESHEITKRHPRISDKRQGFGHKNDIDHLEELIHVVSETSKINKVVRDGATDRQKLLASKPRKDARADLQSSIESCLQQEQEIIREGSKKLLQIHSEILIRQHPPIEHIKGLVHKPETTLNDNNFFSKTCCKVQKQQLMEKEGSPSLATIAELVNKSNEDSMADTIGEAQQSHGSIINGQHSLQLTLTKNVAPKTSPKEDEHVQHCFATLNNTKLATGELDVNIPIPNISTSFEKKVSISGCTVSLAIDQGSSTDSVNGDNEFIQDVTSVDRTTKYNMFHLPKEGQFDMLQSSKDKGVVKPTVCITMTKDFVSIHQQVEISPTPLENIQFDKNHEAESTDKINDYQIETTFKDKQAENKNASFHILEENHVDFLSEIQETAISDKARSKSSIREYPIAKVVDKISTVIDSSQIAIEEYPSVGKDVQQQDDALLASKTLTCNVEKIQLTTSFTNTHTNSTSLCMYLTKEVNHGDDLVLVDNNIEGTRSLEKKITSKKEKIPILSLTTTSPKKESVDIVHFDTCTFCHKSETAKFTSSEHNLSSRIIHASKISLDEQSVHDINFLVNSSCQDVYVSQQNTTTQKSKLEGDRKDVTLEYSEVVTPTTSSSLKYHSTFEVQDVPLQNDQTSFHPNFIPIQLIETKHIELNIPTTQSMSQLHNSNAISSPLITTPPTASPTVCTTSTHVNVKNEAAKPYTTSSDANSNGKVGTSRQKPKKKKARMHQDAKTMVFVRSDTQFGYNGPRFAHPDLLLHQDVIQDNTMENVINPSLYDFANTQSVETIMHQRTNTHLIQAQTTAEEAIFSATSALAQSHYEWSQMQNQIFYPRNTQKAQLHLSIMRKAQIASIAASVAATRAVAKAAVEAAKAIQEASKEALELCRSSQSNFGQSRFARISEMLAHHSDILEVTNCQPLKFKNPSKIITTSCRKRNKRRTSFSPKDELKIDNPTPCMDLHYSSHVEVKDLGANPPQLQASDLSVHSDNKGVEGVTWTKGASSGNKSDEVVEVMTQEIGLQGGWFVAKVLMKTDKEAFVQYNELFRDDGCTPCRNLFPLSSIREEDAYGRIEYNDRRWLRPVYPSKKSWKPHRRSMLPQTWTIGNHVDAFSKGGWWEGVIVEIDKVDNTNITIHFPGKKGIVVEKTWDIRPSLIWTGDKWRPWNENFTKEDEHSFKRQKLDCEKVKAKREDPIENDKPLKKLVEDFKPNFDRTRRRVSHRLLEARKKANKAITMNLMSKKCDKQHVEPSCQTHVLETWGNPSKSKETTSSCPSSRTRTRTISTRLQHKIEAQKQKNLRNLVASKVLQKGVKTISTRSDTMKLKPKSIQTKLLKALKKTSHKRISHDQV